MGAKLVGKRFSLVLYDIRLSNFLNFALIRPHRSEISKASRREDIVPDTVNLIIWLLAGVIGGSAAGELLKGDYDLGPGNMVAGGIGGVIGAQIVQLLIPALRGLDVGPIVGQVIGAAASAAVLTVVTGAVRARRRRRR